MVLNHIINQLFLKTLGKSLYISSIGTFKPIINNVTLTKRAVIESIKGVNINELLESAMRTFLT
jgi:hypothetical protein